MVECHIRNGGHTSTVLGEAEEVGASALGAAAALLSIQLNGFVTLKTADWPKPLRSSSALDSTNLHTQTHQNA